MYESLYHRGSLKGNIVLTALSYTFDALMRSFLQQNHEFPSPLSRDTSISDTLLPEYDNEFKDLIDCLCQERYIEYYDRIKKFCLDNWISIYYNMNKNKTSFNEILHDFSTSLDTDLERAFGQNIECDLESRDIREGIEQMLMNLVGVDGAMNCSLVERYYCRK